MRVRLASCPPGLVAAVRAIAPEAAWVPGQDDLVVPGPATDRPRVLDVVRAFGADIRGLTAEEGRLDTFYRDLVQEHQ
jgi:hypothetical protein